MKLSIFLAAILALAISSCRRENMDCSRHPDQALKGSWRMVAVTDNSSGLVTTRPSSLEGDVDISFSSLSGMSGTLDGVTPTNKISPSDYEANGVQQLTINFLAITKVVETPWGNEFVSNIRQAQHYSFESNGNLDIQTVNKILTFQKY